MRFIFPIKLLSAPRPRFNGHAYMPANYKEQKKIIRELIGTKATIAFGPLKMSIRIETKGKRLGDVDNLAKTILDSLEGLCYLNDIQITSLEVTHVRTGSDLVLVNIEDNEQADSNDYKKI